MIVAVYVALTLLQSAAVHVSASGGCSSHHLFNGTWDNLGPLKTGSKEFPAEQLTARFHSSIEQSCSLSDFLKAAKDPIVCGHLTEKNEFDMILRLSNTREKTWLSIGTSIDHRNLRIGCPVFGQERKVLLHRTKSESILVAHCKIPVLDVTLAYVFGGALSLASLEEKSALYEAIHEALGLLNLPKVGLITLSGIEWDLKENKNVNISEYEQSVESNIKLISRRWPSTPMSLRTQYYSVDNKGISLASIARIEELNEVFHNVAQKSHTAANSNKIFVSDMRNLMRFNGTYASGWTDGLHPSGWVTLQYMNLVLHQMNDVLIV
jgi:hypothetical protein